MGWEWKWSWKYLAENKICFKKLVKEKKLVKKFLHTKIVKFVFSSFLNTQLDYCNTVSKPCFPFTAVLLLTRVGGLEVIIWLTQFNCYCNWLLELILAKKKQWLWTTRETNWWSECQFHFFNRRLNRKEPWRKRTSWNVWFQRCVTCKYKTLIFFRKF